MRGGEPLRMTSKVRRNIRPKNQKSKGSRRNSARSTPPTSDTSLPATTSRRSRSYCHSRPLSEEGSAMCVCQEANCVSALTLYPVYEVAEGQRPYSINRSNVSCANE